MDSIFLVVFYMFSPLLIENRLAGSIYYKSLVKIWVVFSLLSLLPIFVVSLLVDVLMGNLERTRALYERLLDRTKHYKVWWCVLLLQNLKLLQRNKKKTRKRKTKKK